MGCWQYLSRESSRVRRLGRSLVLLPWLFPPVATATVFLWMFESPQGVFDSVFKSLHLTHTTPYFFQTSNDALIIVILLNIWIGIPFNFLVIQSGLQSIPPNLHEAAVVDGANWWKELTRVTIPMLRETLLTVLMLGILGTMNVFAFVWILTQGGPADATMLPGLLAYAEAFVDFQYGQGAAIILIVVVVLLVSSRPRSCSTRSKTPRMSAAPRRCSPTRKGYSVTSLAERPVPAGVAVAGKESERLLAPQGPSVSKSFAAGRRHLGRLGLLITMFCLLFPVYWLVQSSFSTQLELFHTPAYFFPRTRACKAFRGAWPVISGDLWHSAVIAMGTVVVTLFVAITAGYGICWPGRAAPRPSSGYWSWWAGLPDHYVRNPALQLLYTPAACSTPTRASSSPTLCTRYHSVS